ncbi:cysteine-rich protein [Burdock mottle virus]|uniref:Cysteine-rich protein n=1 Tax=Burdock mottle virus TaxID=1324959 RepID=S6B9G1_9VIRU|nr:cysteine-rich protein [Burdock mottle virus]BAN62709.1 cysteine-rich protein [Burdock mottle virus]
MGGVSIFVEGDCVFSISCELPVALAYWPRINYVKVCNAVCLHGQIPNSFHLGLICNECENSWLVKVRTGLHTILVDGGFCRVANSKTVQGMCYSCLGAESKELVTTGLFETSVKRVKLS